MGGPLPIPELLVAWRERAVDAGLAPLAEGLALKAFAAAATRPSLYELGSKLARVTPWELGGRALPVLEHGA